MTDEQEIGPYYRLLGAVCLFAALGFAGWKMYSGNAFDWRDIVVLGILVLVVFALIRPKIFDETFRGLMDRLPWTRYTKPPEDPKP